VNPKYKLRWARGEFRLPWVLAHRLKTLTPVGGALKLTDYLNQQGVQTPSFSTCKH
jgi:hypothetical protein